MSALLEVKDLTVQLKMDSGMREVITGTTLTIGQGEAMGLVGESGSGKSMTDARSCVWCRRRAR